MLGADADKQNQNGFLKQLFVAGLGVHPALPQAMEAYEGRLTKGARFFLPCAQSYNFCRLNEYEINRNFPSI